jgi:hypothetical protein
MPREMGASCIEEFDMLALRPSRPAVSSASCTKAVGQRYARLRLERLEDRNAPATVTLSVTYNLGRSITLSGDLSGGTPSNAFQTINLGGMVGGTTTTNASGHYEATLIARGLGDVTARWAMGPSNTATFTLTDQAPVITEFVATEGQDHVWTLSGTVQYFRYFDQLTILFGGQPIDISGKSTTADSTGHFSLTVVLNGQSTDNGTASCQAISPWGTKSDLVCDYIFQTGT